MSTRPSPDELRQRQLTSVSLLLTISCRCTLQAVNPIAPPRASGREGSQRPTVELVRPCVPSGAGFGMMILVQVSGQRQGPKPAGLLGLGGAHVTGLLALIGGQEHQRGCEPIDRRLLRESSVSHPEVAVLLAATTPRRRAFKIAEATAYWRRVGARARIAFTGRPDDVEHALELLQQPGLCCA